MTTPASPCVVCGAEAQTVLWHRASVVLCEPQHTADWLGSPEYRRMCWAITNVCGWGKIAHTAFDDFARRIRSERDNGSRTTPDASASHGDPAMAATIDSGGTP